MIGKSKVVLKVIALTLILAVGLSTMALGLGCLILRTSKLRSWQLDLTQLWHQDYSNMKVWLIDVVEPKSNNLLERFEIDDTNENYSESLISRGSYQTGQEIGLRRFWDSGLLEVSIFTLTNQMLRFDEDVYPNKWVITDPIFYTSSANRFLHG